MKLTADLVEGSFQFMNKSTRDRELDLRDYKIPVIENLGATLDQFDCIDFTDNDIRRLEGFPLLARLKRLYLSNNRIVAIDGDLHECLPNLEGVILNNNQLAELGDIDPLAKCTKLEVLSLIDNPLCSKQHYRFYVINRLPALRLLDFKKVTAKEREEAKKLFSGVGGRKLEQDIGIKSKTFSVQDPLKVGSALDKRKLSAQEMDLIRMAITRARTLQDVQRLEQILQSGQIPSNTQLNTLLNV